MIDKSTGFARYSRPLSWVIALISVLVAIMTFTGEAANATLLGFLWLAVAVAFALSAMFLTGSGAQKPDEPTDSDSAGD